MKVGRNHPSLINVPLTLGSPNFKGVHKALSYHSFCVDIFKPRITLAINWNFRKDPRNLWRAYLRNGWQRGSNVFVLEGEEFVPIKLRPKVSEQVVFRLCRALGCGTLNRKYVYRYAFNLACNFPDINLKNVHIHHINGVENILGNDNILAATDDRVCNLEVVDIQHHTHIHNSEGDRQFFFYTKQAPDTTDAFVHSLSIINHNRTTDLQHHQKDKISLSKLAFWFYAQLDNIQLSRITFFLHLLDDHVLEQLMFGAGQTSLFGQSVVLQVVIFFVLLARLLRVVGTLSYHSRLLILDNFLSRKTGLVAHRAFEYLLDTG